MKRTAVSLAASLALHLGALCAFGALLRLADATGIACQPRVEVEALELSLCDTPDEAAPSALAGSPGSGNVAVSERVAPPSLVEQFAESSMPTMDSVSEPVVSTASPPPADFVVRAEVGEAVSVPAPDHAAVEVPPKPLAGLRAVYPRRSRQSGEEGEVTVEAEIDAAGLLVGVRIVSPSPFAALDAAAMAAMRTARFAPAENDGRKVAGKLQQRFIFRLRK